MGPLISGQFGAYHVQWDISYLGNLGLGGIPHTVGPLLSGESEIRGAYHVQWNLSYLVNLRLGGHTTYSGTSLIWD